MSKEPEEKGKSKEFLKNVKWVAHYLGVSRNTIHQWVTEDHIPYINLGVAGGRRIIRFDQDVIDEWLYKRSYTPGQEKTEEADEQSDKEIE
jgi:excisionase family DNA binding protein